jgi:hypothetical protein
MTVSGLTTCMVERQPRQACESHAQKIRREPRAWARSVEDGELVSEHEDFHVQRRS